MIDDVCIQRLVSAVVSEKAFSHCRLCLKENRDECVRFHDCLPYDSVVFMSLADILKKVFGNEICQEIAGLDAVCVQCAEQAVQTFKFIEKCEKSSKLLHSIFDNVNSALNVEFDTTDNQKLFVVVSLNETNLVLVNNEPAEAEVPQPIEKIHMCFDCNMVFEDIHAVKHHNFIRHCYFTCEKCLDTFTNEKDQMDHDSSEQMHICEHCNDYYCTESSLQKHKDNAHDSTYVCKICGKIVKGLRKLTLHEKTHILRNTCAKCGKSYSTKNSYIKHVKLCLENKLVKHPIRSTLVRDHICDLCGKAYSTASGLRVHERFVHGYAKPHVCEFCHKQFTAPSYLKAHLVKHTGEKNHACQLCNGKFGTKEALIYHTRRHTGEKPYSCHICDQQFVNSSARAEHIKYKHVGPTLMCDICPRKFVTPTHLKYHRVKHFDPTHKLYAPRAIMPANVPGGDNIRVRMNENHSHKQIIVYSGENLS